MVFCSWKDWSRLHPFSSAVCNSRIANWAGQGVSLMTLCHCFPGDYLEKMIPLIVQYCNVEDDELREYCFQAFESFVRRLVTSSGKYWAVLQSYYFQVEITSEICVLIRHVWSWLMGGVSQQPSGDLFLVASCDNSHACQIQGLLLGTNKNATFIGSEILELETQVTKEKKHILLL